MKTVSAADASGQVMTVQQQRGFTLVELVMVIVILGVIGSMVSVFMKGPIDAYFASARRAALTDVADTTLRRMARDIRKALPNSIRTSGTNCLEFIPTKTGGRYRADGSGALQFETPVSSFSMLGNYTRFAGDALPINQQISVNDLVVLNNNGVTGPPATDAYTMDTGTTGANWSAVTSDPTTSGSPTETTIQINSITFSRYLKSPGNRFHVVPSGEKMVSYVCNASDSKLYRTVSNTLTSNASCPTTGSVIASNVNCGSTVFYPPVDLTVVDPNANKRTALARMVLSILDSDNSESVTLQHEVHVDNTP